MRSVELLFFASFELLVQFCFLPIGFTFKWHRCFVHFIMDTFQKERSVRWLDRPLSCLVIASVQLQNMPKLAKLFTWETLPSQRTPAKLFSIGFLPFRSSALKGSEDYWAP